MRSHRILAALAQKGTSQKEGVYAERDSSRQAVPSSYLFVYGTLRRGFNHPMARLLALRARYAGVAWMNGRLYHLGRYPGVTFARRQNEWVQGDLYDLREARGLLARVDRYEGLASRRNLCAEYRRVGTTVYMEDGLRVQAWVYLYQLPVARHKRLVGGDYLRVRRASMAAVTLTRVNSQIEQGAKLARNGGQNSVTA